LAAGDGQRIAVIGFGAIKVCLIDPKIGPVDQELAGVIRAKRLRELLCGSKILLGLRKLLVITMGDGLVELSLFWNFRRGERNGRVPLKYRERVLGSGTRYKNSGLLDAKTPFP